MLSYISKNMMNFSKVFTDFRVVLENLKNAIFQIEIGS